MTPQMLAEWGGLDYALAKDGRELVWPRALRLHVDRLHLC